MGGEMPSMRVYVRWVSALPVRQAIARMRYGSEVADSAEAVSELEREEENYIVSVAPLPARAMRGDPAQLKTMASLNIKGIAPIAPDDVVGQRSENDAEVFFYFPKGQNGSHTIKLQDKEVEFVLKLGNMNIKRKFKLQDMVYNGKLEM